MIYTPSDTPTGERFDSIYTRLCELLRKHPADLVSIEGVFFNRNVKSANSTAGVIAIVQLACQRAGVPLIVIKPQAVKSAVTGSGRAPKPQVVKMVNRLLGAGIKAHHEAAAAAIAGLLKLQTLHQHTQKGLVGGFGVIPPYPPRPPKPHQKGRT